MPEMRNANGESTMGKSLALLLGVSPQRLRLDAAGLGCKEVARA